MNHRFMDGWWVRWNDYWSSEENRMAKVRVMLWTGWMNGYQWIFMLTDAYWFSAYSRTRQREMDQKMEMVRSDSWKGANTRENKGVIENHQYQYHHYHYHNFILIILINYILLSHTHVLLSISPPLESPILPSTTSYLPFIPIQMSAPHSQSFPQHPPARSLHPQSGPTNINIGPCSWEIILQKFVRQLLSRCHAFTFGSMGSGSAPGWYYWWYEKLGMDGMDERMDKVNGRR